MLDQTTDRMWYVIGAVLIGAAIIFGMNAFMPEAFASVGGMFDDFIGKVVIGETETEYETLQEYLDATYGEYHNSISEDYWDSMIHETVLQDIEGMSNEDANIHIQTYLETMMLENMLMPAIDSIDSIPPSRFEQLVSEVGTHMTSATFNYFADYEIGRTRNIGLNEQLGDEYMSLFSEVLNDSEYNYGVDFDYVYYPRGSTAHLMNSPLRLLMELLVEFDSVSDLIQLSGGSPVEMPLEHVGSITINDVTYDRFIMVRISNQDK